MTPENKIICGDCLEVMKDWPNGCVDLVLTDPPYFLPVQHYQTRRQFQRSFSDLGILEHFFRNFFSLISRILNPKGYMYIFCDGQSYPLFYYHSYLISKAVRPLIWNKQTSINGYGWRHQHELILFAEMPEITPIKTGDGDILNCRAVPIDKRRHPAEKPLNLIGKILQKHTTDLILDPFCGSGTTCVAAKMLGRRYIGIDISSEYCKIAEERLEAVETGVPFKEHRKGQMALFEVTK